MKLKFTTLSTVVLLFGFLLFTANTMAQTIAYRQTGLTSNVPNLANNFTPELVNPWGIAFLSGQPFFIAANKTGSVTAHDATGSGVGLTGFVVPNSAGTGPDHPTGIVADQNSFFGGRSFVQPFILVSEEGRVFEWGPDAHGNLLQQATLVSDNSLQGAAYKGVTILNSPLANPALAVTEFHGGFIHTFEPGFSEVALAGSFTDPALPAGYAPFGIQVIGSQVFVTYALQDAAKHDPIAGPGNGIVSIFDMDGNFVKRFATAGPLNAPWGVTQATANFGPFSNDILIGNTGDGTINAFDPATGNFVGALEDGSGNVINDLNLHALTFRSDGFGDANTLYLTAGLAGGLDGVFGAVTPGRVSVTRVSVPATPANTQATISITVSAGPGNTGNPTGSVSIRDGGILLSSPALINGQAVFLTVLTHVGMHAIEVQYSGDTNFLPSSSQTEVQVTGPATMLTFTAPAAAVPGSPVLLTATIHSPGGKPTGQIMFLDGNTDLGTAPLNAAGVATLTINTLAAGAHSLTASYGGDATFSGSTSAAVTISIANKDFSLAATPATVTVIAGQSAQFMVTITPAGGFSDNVTFSCAPVNGITCSFNPARITPTNGAASTMLTVTTSASVPRYGSLIVRLVGPGALFTALLLYGVMLSKGESLRNARASLLTATVAVAIVALSLTLGGCGAYGNSTQPNRGTASVMVIGQSGAISHSATIPVTVQ